MRFLYPQGLNPVRQQKQLRDLIWTYTMGYGDSLLQNGLDSTFEQWKKEWRYISASTWWPDATWYWWT